MGKMDPSRLIAGPPAAEQPAEDDAGLAARARHDPVAFSELYRRYVRRVYRYLYSHVGEAPEAEDLTAQVFTAAWESRLRYREQGAFAAWLFRIARNKIADHFRRRRPQVSLDSDDPPLTVDWDPLGQLAHREALQRISGLVNRLQPREIELLRLRFAADLTYAEIGATLGQSEAAAKMAVRRLLDRLQKEWERNDE